MLAGPLDTWNSSDMSNTQNLAEIVARHLLFDGIEPCALPRVKLIRSSSMSDSMPVVYEPALCLVAQGRSNAEINWVGSRTNSIQKALSGLHPGARKPGSVWPSTGVNVPSALSGNAPGGMMI